MWAPSSTPRLPPGNTRAACSMPHLRRRPASSSVRAPAVRSSDRAGGPLLLRRCAVLPRKWVRGAMTSHLLPADCVRDLLCQAGRAIGAMDGAVGCRRRAGSRSIPIADGPAPADSRVALDASSTTGAGALTRAEPIESAEPQPPTLNPARRRHGTTGRAALRVRRSAHRREPPECGCVGCAGGRDPGRHTSNTPSMLPLALAADRRVRVPRAGGPCPTRADVARRSARAHPDRARGSP